MNNRADPEVIEYLKAENAYTKAILKETEAGQKLLYDEMKGRIKEDDSSVPYLKNGFWYYSRYETGKEYPIHCRKKDGIDQEEEILIDENEIAKDYPYYDMVSFAISLDNSLMAFAEDITGRRIYRIRFKNLTSGVISDDIIEGASSDLVWDNTSNYLYYCEKDFDTLRPYRIMRYSMGNKSASKVFEEEDEAFICSVSLNKDFGHIIISSHSTLTTEYQFKSADDDSAFQLFLPREEGHEYYVELSGETAYIKTNLNAENFKIVSCHLNNRSVDAWKEIQKHSTKIFVEDFEVFDKWLVVQEKLNGLSMIRVYDINTFRSRLIPTKEETYMLYLGTNPELVQTHLRIGYSSMTTPHSVIDIEFESFQEEVKKQQEVIGDFNADNYQSERIWATAKDGKKVPISLVYRKNLFTKNGSNPVLLYAYGSYGSTIDPYFSSVRLSLLDRGFVFAIAHIRGGEYLGHDWYEQGKLKQKVNTFTDFISCAEFLVAAKYAQKENVFAMGGSAGGLLMGAIANMRPDIWKGIVSQVPFVDVVTTMLDDSIPLTTGEYDEWGNPNEKSYYDYMLAYSPYDNIEEKEYPSMLVTSGLHDSQVQYWEPTKYVAKIREHKTNDALVLLHTNMDAGHGGASGRFEALKEIALEYAFIFWLSNVEVK